MADKSSVFDALPTPCYVLDEALIERNLRILAGVKKLTGARILLALKAFSGFDVFPLIRKYLDGTCASSLDEARLGFEEFGKEVHVYAAAYRPDEFHELLKYADHISFNSFDQWRKFRTQAARSRRRISCAIRINPQHSEVKVPLYDPCAKYSRLGVTAGGFAGQDLDGIDGLHFHTLCELNADALERTLEAVERKFAVYLKQVTWVNFGGGHHITRPDYDIPRLVRLVNRFRQKYRVDVYLEPGEAVVLNAGYLVASVLDIVRNEMDIAILDTSAACHMPDVLEMPYRPEIINGGKPGEKKYTYRLAGLTCLAGDVIGDYSFAHPLKAGDRLVFCDMAHYSMVKNNTFNGIRLPSIAVLRAKDKKLDVIKKFRYSDFRNRLS